jgi:hypothetical protein
MGGVGKKRQSNRAGQVEGCLAQLPVIAQVVDDNSDMWLLPVTICQLSGRAEAEHHSDNWEPG